MPIKIFNTIVKSVLQNYFIEILTGKRNLEFSVGYVEMNGNLSNVNIRNTDLYGRYFRVNFADNSTVNFIDGNADLGINLSLLLPELNKILPIADQFESGKMNKEHPLLFLPLRLKGEFYNLKPELPDFIKAKLPLGISENIDEVSNMLIQRNGYNKIK